MLMFYPPPFPHPLYFLCCENEQYLVTQVTRCYPFHTLKRENAYRIQGASVTPEEPALYDQIYVY